MVHAMTLHVTISTYGSAIRRSVSFTIRLGSDMLIGYEDGYAKVQVRGMIAHFRGFGNELDTREQFRRGIRARGKYFKA
jgi:hypothetical protein